MVTTDFLQNLSSDMSLLLVVLLVQSGSQTPRWTATKRERLTLFGKSPYVWAADANEARVKPLVLKRQRAGRRTKAC
jgi:hypothetical protein